jgi:uncharacterized protein
MRAAIALLVVLSLVANSSFALNSEDVALVRKAAERGSDASQVLMGVAYLNGDGGLARDPARAAHWFEQAALQGNSYAETKLGEIYEQGLGVEKNLRLAFDWRLKAANRGDLPAQVAVGKMFRDGQGTDKNAALALHWFKRAATEGNAEAQYLLGRMYHEGVDVREDRVAARSWFEKAARQGYEAATAVLNLIESIGYGLEEGWHHHLPGLKMLANDGDIEAQYQLAQRYEHGVGGLKRDMAQALDWYSRSATGGNRMAMRTLSQIYATGEGGVAPDPVAAKAWAEKVIIRELHPSK